MRLLKTILNALFIFSVLNDQQMLRQAPYCIFADGASISPSDQR